MESNGCFHGKGLEHVYVLCWRKEWAPAYTHRLKCVEKKSKSVSGLGEKELWAGKLDRRPRRSEESVKAPYTRGRLGNWRNRRGPGTHGLFH